jgi:hypothetical protein
LARRDLPEHLADLERQDIRPLDLVVVNLYPFEQTIAKPDVTMIEAVEQIDIGGPAMIRATAKNFAHTVILSNPSQYSDYLFLFMPYGNRLFAVSPQSHRSHWFFEYSIQKFFSIAFCSWRLAWFVFESNFHSFICIGKKPKLI